MEKCNCKANSPHVELTLTNLHDVEKVLREGVMPLRPLRVKLSVMYEQENSRLEKQLNSYIKACGCDTGTYFTLGGLGITTLFFLMDKFNWSWSGVGYAVLVVLGFAFTGKTIGLITARILFFRTLRQVLNTIQPEGFMIDEITAHP